MLRIVLLTGLVGCTMDRDAQAAMRAPGAHSKSTTARPAAQRDGASPVSVRLSEWQLQLSRLGVPTGDVALSVTNGGTVPHALEIEGQGMEQETERLQPGATSTMRLSLARYLLRDEHDAQDVVQDAALRALRYFDGYRDGDARSWLLAIVRSCCLTWQRRHRADRLTIPLGDGDALGIPDARATDALAIARSDRAALERAVVSLPTEFREVIVLREIEGLSYRDISEVVGAPIGTVMSCLSRARKRLAGALGHDVQEAS